MLQNFKRHLKTFILAGNNSYCPCCGKSFVTFMPFDVRYGAECPFCISLERHRLISLFIAKNSLFSDSSKKMLHVAPEKCLAKPFKDFFQSNYLAGDKFTDGYTGYDKDDP